MFLDSDGVEKLGLKEVGRNVKISADARFHAPHKVSIGDNTRIDDFAVLSGNISLGSNVHLSVHSSIIAPRSPVSIGDFCTISFYSCITSANDDYSGNFMTNPTVPSEFTNVADLPVSLEEHSILGAHVLVLPGVSIGRGSAVGSFSLVKKDVPSWEIHAGIPAKQIGLRSKNLLAFSKMS